MRGKTLLLSGLAIGVLAFANYASAADTAAPTTTITDTKTTVTSAPATTTKPVTHVAAETTTKETTKTTTVKESEKNSVDAGKPAGEGEKAAKIEKTKEHRAHSKTKEVRTHKAHKEDGKTVDETTSTTETK